MASSTAARSRKPQPSLGSDDAVALRAAELAAWAQKNVRVIIATAVVLLVVVGGALYYRMSQQARSDRAAGQLMEMQQQVAIAGQAAAPALQNFIQRFDGTVEAHEARLMLGQVYIEQGQAAQAIEPLRQVARSRTPLSFQGSMLLGAAQAEAGEYEEAVRTYTSAADGARHQFQRFAALGEAAVQHEAAGNWAAAAEVYGRMAGLAEEGSREEALLRMRLAEAEAFAAAGPRN